MVRDFSLPRQWRAPAVFDEVKGFAVTFKRLFQPKITIEYPEEKRAVSYTHLRAHGDRVDRADLGAEPAEHAAA